MCGVFGAVGEEPAKLVAIGISYLEHRGHEATGVVATDGAKFFTFGSKGGPNQVLAGGLPVEMGPALAAIGHNRYSNTGSHDNPNNVQPVKGEGPNGAIWLAHNGNFPDALQTERGLLEARGAKFTTTMDSEVLVQMIAWETGDSWYERLQKVMAKLVNRGTYTLVILTSEGLMFARDPHGNRPASYGKYDGGWLVSSEDSPLHQLNCSKIYHLGPGQVAIFDLQGNYRREQAVKPGIQIYCSFEGSYLSLPTSSPDGFSVSAIRYRQGEALADNYPVPDADVVIGIPDSGIPVGLGFAFRSGIPYKQLILRDRHNGHRTFIEPDSEIRRRMAELKYLLDRGLRGLRVVFGEDSIIRALTMLILCGAVHRAGARSIDIRVGHPPITHDCFYGVDMKTDKGLVAEGRAKEETEAFLEEMLGVRSVRFLSKEQNAATQGRDPSTLCYGSSTGDYRLPGINGLVRFKGALEAV